MSDDAKPTPLTLTDLEELERLEREATGGPWRIGESNTKHVAGIDVEHEKLGIEIWNSLDAATDAALIVAARNRLPQLLALSRIGLLAVAENEAQKAVPRGPVVEGMDLTTTQAWMMASEKLDEAIMAYKEGQPKP